jgi:L-ascorbate metabolism protein UlaG (beta-lactamase superfamily)
MKLIKIIHSTILLELKGKRILFDPGSYSTGMLDTLISIDYLIYTHTHGDHYNETNLKLILANNPSVIIVTNSEVKALLDQLNIPHTILLCENHNTIMLEDIKLQSFENKHLEIWKEIGQVQNTSYLVDDYFYNPADSFEIPSELKEIPPKVALLPVAGPPIKVSEAIQFAIDLNAKTYIAVHDGMLLGSTGSTKIPEKILPDFGISFIVPELGKEIEI